jgi:hypothetical protein
VSRLLALAPRLLGSLPLLLLAVEAFARAGGGQGYSSSSSGGSWSGGGFSGGSGFGGYRSSGGDGGFIALWIDLSLARPEVGIPVNLFLLYIVYQCLAVRHERRRDETIAAGLEKQAELRLRSETAQLKARDGAFEEGRFLERVRAAFVKVQAAWSAGDMKAARAFISDGVDERFSRQLADLKERGLTNVVDGVEVLEQAVLGCVSDPHYDALHVGIRAKVRDRTVDAKGDLMAVDDGEFQEVWTFLRRPGAKTLKGDGAIEGRCPNCGSPLAVADAGACAACKSFVSSGDHDWVLSEITQREEWSGHDAERDVDNWRAFADADPALNEHAVEDRASVMFWRWLDALRRQDPAPLLPVSTAERAKALLEDAPGHSWHRPAVGGVQLISCERAGAFDRLHVQVRWEAAPLPFGPSERPGARQRLRHFLILERAAGARTDGRWGMRSLRCASCGAPPGGRDQAACAYCSKPFNDGSRDWVLREIVPFGRWKRPSSSCAAAAPPPMPGLDWDGGIAPAEAAAVLARAVFADGEVSPHEERFLREYGLARGIPSARVTELLEAAQGGLLDAPRPADGPQAEAMLRGLARMSLADGRVTDAEQAALSAFGKRFGLHHNDVKSLVDEERGALYARLRR